MAWSLPSPGEGTVTRETCSTEQPPLQKASDRHDMKRQIHVCVEDDFCQLLSVFISHSRNIYANDAAAVGDNSLSNFIHLNSRTHFATILKWFLLWVLMRRASWKPPPEGDRETSKQASIYMSHVTWSHPVAVLLGSTKINTQCKNNKQAQRSIKLLWKHKHISVIINHNKWRVFPAKVRKCVNFNFTSERWKNYLQFDGKFIVRKCLISRCAREQDFRCLATRLHFQ